MKTEIDILGIRTARGLTQDEVAVFIGVNSTTVGRMEKKPASELKPWQIREYERLASEIPESEPSQ